MKKSQQVLLKHCPMSQHQIKREKSTNLSKGVLALTEQYASAEAWLSYNLKDNKSNASPGSICFFDTETWYDKSTAYETGQFQRLRLGVAISGRLEAGKWTRQKVCRFRTSDEFWAFIDTLLDKTRPLWLFAHNIGFDLTTTCFPELLRKGEYVIEDPNKKEKKTDILGKSYTKNSGFLCTDDPPVIVSCHKRSGEKLIAVDTFNYFTTSLEKLGKTIGVNKGNLSSSSETDESLFAYCEQDVRIIWTAILGLIRWVKDNNLGKFRFTAPSQAMASFRHRWNKPAIKCHNQNFVRKLERKAYYGGRLECFYIGKVEGTLYELDVTSLYPSVMKGELYPCRLIDYYTRETHTSTKACSVGLDTVATVRLKTLEGFPKRDNALGTFYPIGEYWTTLAGPELLYAYEKGYVQDILDWSKYELRDIFTGFIDFFWDYRKDQKKLGNDMNDNLAKLLMNGLYGKFGQMTSAWENRPDIPVGRKLGIYIDETFADGGSKVFRSIGNMIQQFTGKGEHPNAFPAISAYVTSYARQWMRNMLLVAGNHNCYYLVTDALFVNQAGWDNLNSSSLIGQSELGLLTVKHRAEIGEFSAIHHYRIGDHAVNGSRKKSARVNPDGSCTELQFESFEKILSRMPDGSVHVKPVTKTFSKQYKRGTIGSDGWVRPLVLEEE